MKQLILEVANIKIRITSNIKGIIERFKEMYSDFIIFDSQACYVTLEISSDNMEKYLNKSLLPFELNDSILQTNYLYFSAYDPLRKKAHLLTNIDNAYPCAEEYLLKLFSYICLENKKLLFHCAFLYDDNFDAYIFFGPSGIGKSTVAKNSKNHHILTDDIIVLEKLENNAFKAYKTPFERNKKKSNGENIFKIKGFFRLNQSDFVNLNRLKPAESLANVLGNIWNIDLSKESYNTYLELISNDYKNIPCFNLYLKNDESFWDEIRKVQ